MRPHRDGFLLITALFVLSGFLTISIAGLGRSVTELNASTRSGALTQALHAAEAGVDDALRAFSSGAFQRTDGWNTTATCVDPCRTKTLTLQAGLTAVSTVNDIGAFESTAIIRGSVGNPAQLSATQTLQVRLRRASSVPPAFRHVITGTTLNMDGNASIGDPFNANATMYLNGPPDRTGSLATSGSNDVYAAEINFYNPANDSLADLCPNCNNASIIHQPVTFLEHAPPLPEIELDLRPYYAEAARQGHVISSDTAYDNANLTGVYYVECGVDLTFSGTSTVRGTIVHEGCVGNIKVTSNSSLTIDSTNGAQFAPGMAIVGAPSLGFGGTTTVNVNGFIMHHGPASVFAPTGTIEGD